MPRGRKQQPTPTTFNNRFQKSYYKRREDISKKRRELYACRRLAGQCVICGKQTQGLYCEQHTKVQP